MLSLEIRKIIFFFTLSFYFIFRPVASFYECSNTLLYARASEKRGKNYYKSYQRRLFPSTEHLDAEWRWLHTSLDRQPSRNLLIALEIKPALKVKEIKRIKNLCTLFCWMDVDLNNLISHRRREEGKNHDKLLINILLSLSICDENLSLDGNAYRDKRDVPINSWWIIMKSVAAS